MEANISHPIIVSSKGQHTLAGSHFEYPYFLVSGACSDVFFQLALFYFCLFLFWCIDLYRIIKVLFVFCFILISFVFDDLASQHGFLSEQISFKFGHFLLCGLSGGLIQGRCLAIWALAFFKHFRVVGASSVVASWVNLRFVSCLVILQSKFGIIGWLNDLTGFLVGKLYTVNHMLVFVYHGYYEVLLINIHIVI